MNDKDRLQQAKEQDPGLQQTYRDVFDSEQGKIILLDLERLASAPAKWSESGINPSVTEYSISRVAQDNLIRYIKNKLR